MKNSIIINLSKFKWTRIQVASRTIELGQLSQAVTVLEVSMEFLFKIKTKSLVNLTRSVRVEIKCRMIWLFIHKVLQRAQMLAAVSHVDQTKPVSQLSNQCQFLQAQLLGSIQTSNSKMAPSSGSRSSKVVLEPTPSWVEVELLLSLQSLRWLELQVFNGSEVRVPQVNLAFPRSTIAVVSLLLKTIQPMVSLIRLNGSQVQ